VSGGHEFAGASDLVISPRLRRMFPFCVECKHRANFRLEHVFGLNKDFCSYHAQVIEACEREGNTRAPMVVIRGNGGAIFASIPVQSLREMNLELPAEAAVIIYRYEQRLWIMTEFDDLLAAIASKAVPEAAQTATAAQ
jgi:hypothetical protein